MKDKIVYIERIGFLILSIVLIIVVMNKNKNNDNETIINNESTTIDTIDKQNVSYTLDNSSTHSGEFATDNIDRPIQNNLEDNTQIENIEHTDEIEHTDNAIPGTVDMIEPVDVTEPDKQYLVSVENPAEITEELQNLKAELIKTQLPQIKTNVDNIHSKYKDIYNGYYTLTEISDNEIREIAGYLANYNYIFNEILFNEKNREVVHFYYWDNQYIVLNITMSSDDGSLMYDMYIKGEQN